MASIADADAHLTYWCMTQPFADRLPKLLALIEEKELPFEDRLKALCVFLKFDFEHYDWVGFYLADPHAERMLVLGPYIGAPTGHTLIPFGRGICGQAAETLETFVVQDVNAESNYLSCSVNVKSEIVLPIILPSGKLVAELDIDSNTLAAFKPEDQAFLEQICAHLAQHWPDDYPQ